jgi:NAD(P)-dependent dehydrogenase (short-subunit alcohol dehydrogenase family)
VLEGVNLSGKRILITGVSAGLGVETARAAAAHGGTVVGTARDLQKVRRALAAVLLASERPERNVQIQSNARCSFFMISLLILQNRRILH